MRPIAPATLRRGPDRRDDRRAEGVLGIHGEFARATDQSCLNRFLTAAPWDFRDPNRRRLGLLPKDPSTRSSDPGVIPLDKTLIDRDGRLIPDAGWDWDRAEDRSKIAQDDLSANSVWTGGRPYPPAFRLFRKEEIGRAFEGTVPRPCRPGLRLDRPGLSAADPRLQRLMTISEASRAMLREALRTTLTRAIEPVTERAHSVDRVMAQVRRG